MRRRLLLLVLVATFSFGSVITVIQLMTQENPSTMPAVNLPDPMQRLPASDAIIVRESEEIREQRLEASESVNVTAVMEIQRQRQRHLAEACRRRGGGHVTSDKPRLPKHVLASIFAVDKIRTLYCVLGKVASTSWMQVLVIASGKLPASTKPQDLHWIHNGRENARYLHRLSVMDPAAARFRLNSYYKFVIVRHPFDRLVSAFREKFSGNKEQYRQLEKRIIRRYRKTNDTSERVKFPEFARFLLDEKSQSLQQEKRDRHWRPQFRMCSPCRVAYDFIGHFETMYDDAAVLLPRIGIKSDIFPRDYARWSQAAARRNETLSTLTADTVDQLKQLYAGDFELFGY